MKNKDDTIMNEWKKVKIGDVCDTISQTFKSDISEVVLVNTSDVLEGKVLNHKKVPNKKLKGQFKKQFIQDDILYSEIRPKNKRFAYVDFNADGYIASTKLMVLRSKTDIVYPKYLFQILKSDKIINELQMLAETRSGTFPQITFSELSNLEIYIPAVEEQKKIAHFLEIFDKKIELNDKLNANLLGVCKALYVDYFISCTPFENVVDTEYGIIPDGWRFGQLSELIEVKYGKDHKKLQDGNIPVYGSGGIMRYVDTSLYRGESVLIPRKGSLNNVLYVNEEFWSVDTMFYTIMRDINLAKYVYFFVSSKDLLSMNAGSAVPSMTTDILNKMIIKIPPADVLQSFEEKVSPIFNILKSNTVQNQKLSDMRDTLLPQLMSGAIDLSQVDLEL